MARPKPEQNTDNLILETYSIFWLDASVDNKENVITQKKLRGIINQVRTFADPEEFLQRVNLIQQGDLTILIVSGQLGRIVVPEMQNLEQVCSIYIYCGNKKAHLGWSQSYSKVKAVCTKLDELIDVIRVDQKRRGRNEEPIAMDILDRSSTELNGDFLHSQLLIDVLIKMKPNEQDQKELIELSEKEYEGNEVELKLVKEFQKEYTPNRAIWWYTRESFVYRLLNKALRVRNIEMIFLMRNVIRDVYEQLRTNQCEKPVTVYRGQIMSGDEIKQFRKSVGSIISLNSFLSTSSKREVAEGFLRQSMGSCNTSNSVGVIFKIEADPSVICDSEGDNRRPFSQIDGLSYYGGSEAEILFMVGSIFRLEHISEDKLAADAKIWMIHMRLCGDGENDLKELYNHMKNQGNDSEETNLMSLGLMMWNMGEFDLAEKYLLRRLSELLPNDPSIGGLYRSLGMVANEKGDFDSSLEWHEKSLKVTTRTTPSDYITIGNIHNSIGVVHETKDDHDQALESYNRAVSLFKEADDEKHPDLAMFYNNIGNIYQRKNKYLESLEFYEKSLAIKETHLPADHPDFSVSYNNIGSVHYYLNHYDLALKYYDRSVKIKLKTLPAEHPSIANTYENMGLVYENKDQLEEALKLFKKSQIIYEAALPVNHPQILKVRNDVGRVEDLIKRNK
ncbi:unnamed protein product [Rotaria magnacalcarata]|uniref:Uncharacterized protein n=1 Tax=Rotaria magnacalcarata TaxID=392030 RepID=A0A816VAH9_9BILA|nr:unnamed protein product [Rotaria magnacalcarata]CAF4050545.1 unnamed protein product [Rotaria magnacalcarata]